MSKTIRNPIAVAMNKRHSHSAPMKDRRSPRGGSRNLMREFLDDAEETYEVQREVSRTLEEGDKQ